METPQGHKDVLVEGAVVPAYRTHLVEELRDTSIPRAGRAVNAGPLFRLSWMNIFSWAIPGK